ncbi:MAG: menaquinone biosynthesis protein [Acidobacteria bacterium]|nr:menaquinone biosynthesis protein [Acidobacteriota bacterium]MYE43072.1 menaquinone biosynthesis protein [Acidobacteriota bacterium]
MRLLLGQLAYLNTQPFEPLPGLRVFRASPSEIGRLAATSELDAGLLSAGDLIRNEGRYSPLGDARGAFGIACRNEAGSVFLLSRRPAEQLGGKIVEITRETSTSVLLLQLWLEQRLGIERPEYRLGVTREHEAVLLIGDEALRERERPDARFPYRFDLAARWKEWTGLPFVFAVWSARRSLSAAKRSGLEETISASLERGIERIPEIAEAAAGPLGDGSTIARYLLDFTYRFDEPERVGFETFRQLARKRNLVPSSPATRDGGAPC